MNIDDLNNFYKTNIESQLSDDVRNALSRYTLVEYKHINDYLLGYSDSCISKKELKRLIELIRKGISLSNIPESLIVYHGTSLNLFNNKHIEDYLINNSTVVTKTFLSTSLDKDCSINASSGHDCWMEPVVLKIFLPKGYPGFWMNPLSLYAEENEILLANNIKFDFIGYGREDDKKNYRKCLIIDVKPHCDKII